MIQIPLEIGDTILAGRFKNKKIVVKEIDVDDFGLPTINGRGILKIRIPKLYVKENNMKRKINEGSNDMIPAKIKKEDGRYYIYIQQPNGTEKNITNVGFETEDLALHSVLTKGFTLVNDKGDPKPNKFTDLPKAVTQRSNEFKLSENSLKALKKLIVEVLSELEVTGDDVDKIEQLAKLSDMMDQLKNEMAKIKAQFDPLNEEITKMMEEADKMGERALETKNILITIKKKGNSSVEVAAYKERFERLYSRVNAAMKKQEDEWWNLHKTFKKMPTIIGVQYKNKPTTEANFVGGVIGKVKNWLTSKYKKLFQYGVEIDKEIAALKKMI